MVARTLCALAMLTVSLSAAAQRLEAVSYGSPDIFGTEASAFSEIYGHAMSADGDRVVFDSFANNLVPDDRNVTRDVFLFDRSEDSLRRVSVGAGGVEANGLSYRAAISGDGSVVAFESFARNLHPDDDSAFDTPEVHVVDINTGAVERISVSALPGGGIYTCAPALSGDGRFVLVHSAGGSCVFGHVWLHDRQQQTSTLISAPNGIDPASVQIAPQQYGLSSDGRYAVMALTIAGSRAVWIYDRVDAAWSIASRNSAGELANGDSGDPAISADGNRVVFVSSASNLGVLRSSVFVRDFAAGTTTWLSEGFDGAGPNGSFIGGPTISADGSTVAYCSDATNLVATAGTGECYRVDVASRAITRVPFTLNIFELFWGLRVGTAAGGTLFAASSPEALVPGDTNGVADAFLFDSAASQTQRISVSTTGAHPLRGAAGMPRITADGRRVVFTGGFFLGDTSDPYVHDRLTAMNSSFPGARQGQFADTNATATVLLESTGELFLRFDTGATTAVAPAGAPNAPMASGVLAANAPLAAYASAASNIVMPAGPAGIAQVYVRDYAMNTTTMISRVAGVAGNGASDRPAFSADGRYIAFDTLADNLVPGDTNGVADVVLHDRVLQTWTRVSVAHDAAQANGASTARAVSANGTRIVFLSSADNLVPGDTNGVADAFVRDVGSGTTRRVSVATGGAQADAASLETSISADGRYVTLVTAATNLAPGTPPGFRQVYRRDLLLSRTELVSCDADGTPGDNFSDQPRLSATGETIAFRSGAENWQLDAGLDGTASDVFVKELRTEVLFRDGFDD